MDKLKPQYADYILYDCPKCLSRGWYLATAHRVVLRRQEDGSVMPKSITEEFRRTCDCHFGDVWCDKK